jgi:hypothetical protein
MRSIALSRIVFGRARISLIRAALLFGTTLIAANARAQLTETSQPPGSQSGGMEHKETPTSLNDLVQEAEQKNPQIAAAYHGAQAVRYIAKQVSAFPETQVSVQQFSVGSPRPFAGYSNSDFAYIGFGASQDIPFPGKQVCERAHWRNTGLNRWKSRAIRSPFRGRKSQDGVFPPGLHSANARRFEEE